MQKLKNEYVENRWKDSSVYCVIYFARNSNWGFVAPAFSQNKMKLNADGHVKFMQSKNEFLKAFHKI